MITPVRIDVGSFSVFRYSYIDLSVRDGRWERIAEGTGWSGGNSSPGAFVLPFKKRVETVNTTNHTGRKIRYHIPQYVALGLNSISVQDPGMMMILRVKEIPETA